MFNRYFQQELDYLRELGEEFSKAHPALSPMLSGPTSDPDVERLLEGVAFLTGLLRQKLDDEFPEITHDLMQLISPHYLRPIPATSILALFPKQTLKQTLTVPAGIHFASVPVDGTSCLFRTAYGLELHPLNLLDAAFSQPSGQPPLIKLLFELGGMNLSEWQPRSLRLFLSGVYARATDLYLLLRHHLKRIVIRPLDGGTSCTLPREFLKPVGFANDEALILYPPHSFPGYRVLQEYFVSPQKFLFLDLTGWERWQNRGGGSRFEVSFELDELPFAPPDIKRGGFTLFATPAINIFPHEADPVVLDHRRTEYLVRPSGANNDHYQVYSLEKVVGYVQGTAEERRYVPFEFFNPDPVANPVYHITRRESPIRPGFDFYLSVAYPPDAGPPPSSETLSISLLATNGSLPETLQIGDINQPTGSSPEFVECKNILTPTHNILPPLGTNLIWRLLSHLSLNYRSVARTDNLKALLELYVFSESRDHASARAHKRRIGGIESVKTTPADRLVSGIAMRGQEIRMKVNRDHFASEGDLYLFGCILDDFFGGYASMNSYTSTIIQESVRGSEYRWPVRIGNRHLL